MHSALRRKRLWESSVHQCNRLPERSYWPPVGSGWGRAETGLHRRARLGTEALPTHRPTGTGEPRGFHWPSPPCPPLPVLRHPSGRPQASPQSS